VDYFSTGIMGIFAPALTKELDWLEMAVGN
jgi:hypothetical protein